MLGCDCLKCDGDPFDIIGSGSDNNIAEFRRFREAERARPRCWCGPDTNGRPIISASNVEGFEGMGTQCNQLCNPLNVFREVPRQRDVSEVKAVR